MLRGSRGADHFDGGDAVDTDRYLQGGALSASLMDGTGTGGEADGDSYAGIENLTGGHDDDLLEGDDGANVLLGDTTESLYSDVRGAGWDTLIGHGGDDTLNGGTYRSDYAGSGCTADVAVYGGPRARYDITGTANDGSSAMTVADSAPGGDGTDTLFNIGSPVFSDGVMVMATPRSAPLNMPTTEEDDTIYGSAVYVQDFMLYGKGGDDLFLPGLYARSFHGGIGTDRVDFSAFTTGIVVDLATRSGTGDGAMTFVSIEDITGTGYGNRLAGDDAAHRFTGGRGNDTIEGGSRQDAVVFGVALADAAFSLDADGLIVSSAEGADLLMPDVESLVFSDTTLGFQQAVAQAGTGPDIDGTEVRGVLEGTFMGERITVLGGSDWVTPGRGNDTVDGGAGNDMVA